MNVINLKKDIINFEFKKDCYNNNLLITDDNNDFCHYKNFDNIKKICIISKNIYYIKQNIDDFIVTNIEKLYKTNYNMIFLTRKNYIDDITFIIAGYESVLCNINRINCYLYGKFIQSTIDKYTNDDLGNLENASKNNYMTHRNMYNQMYNVHRVLNLVNTEYCVKHRSDEYYINMEEYINIMKNENKLIINNLFLTAKEYYISDHLFGCKLIDFKNMINNLKLILENKILIDNRYLTHTEKLFGVAYLYNKYSFNDLINNEDEIFKNNFFIYSCDNFDNYIITTCSVPTSTHIINSKDGRKNIIQKKYRVFINKTKGYIDDECKNIAPVDLINNIRTNIMFLKNF